MSLREQNDRLQNDRKINSHEPMNPLWDQRVKMIYDRYHTGKSIILDDLRYLWRKDPEGCEKLARSIVEAHTGDGQEVKLNPIAMIDKNDIDCVNDQPGINHYNSNVNDQQNILDYNQSPDTPITALKNVLESMTSVKSLLENMSEQELMDMLDNLNEAIEIKKLTNKMKYWDDKFVDKMTMYTYEEEKEFNKLA